MSAVLSVLPGLLGQRYGCHLAILEQKGVGVIRQDSPSAAVSLAGVCHPDLMIVGLSMPGMDGLEMIALLQDQHASRVPVVVLPDPGDPLDALVCSPVGGSGRFSVVHYPSDQIWIRVAELCGLCISAPPARCACG